MKKDKDKYTITYFPMEQRYSIWEHVEGKAPISIIGYDAKDWFHSQDQALHWLKNYKRRKKYGKSKDI